jgi:iron-sulfur cluster repair protein YtfE (RIC family)
MIESIAVARLEHDYLTTLARELAAVVARPEAMEPAALYYLRRRFAQALSRHLEREDRILYPLVIAGNDPVAAETARRLREENGALAEEFADYGRRWTAAAVQADWRCFGLETHDLLIDLQQRIAREETELYPRLAGGKAGTGALSAANDRDGPALMTGPDQRTTP